METIQEKPLDQLAGLDFECGLIDADSIFELSERRKKFAEEATSIIAQNRRSAIDGRPEAAPLEVDVLGTARRLIKAKKIYGEDSPEYKELDKGLELDCERVVGEAERKLAWELFGDSEQPYDYEAGHYTAHGVPLPEIVTAGLTPFAKPEQEVRRINDYVEEATFEGVGQIMRGLGEVALGSTVDVITISECTDEAIEEYKLNKSLNINPDDAYRGMVPEIEKMMIRNVQFRKDDKRVERQLAISGVYITRKVIMNVLKKLGAVDGDSELTKNELSGKQFIDTSARGLIWLAELLDREATLQSGERIFMGEKVEDNHPMDYKSIPLEAEARRAKLAPKPRELKNYIINLEEKGIDPEVAEGLVNTFLKKMLLKVASNDPDKAAIMFDEQTAEGFRRVRLLEALGYDQEARMLQADVERSAPNISYCGAGSCGLVRVNSSDIEAVKARALGLNGDIIYDTERACPSCRSKTVYYDSSGSKACTSCSIHE